MPPDPDVSPESAAGNVSTQEETQVDNEPLEDEKEPGGDSPTEIYARKQYRRAKQLEKELKAEREERIAVAARLETTAQLLSRQPAVSVQQTQEKRLSSDEAWQKVDAGEWTRGQASDYIAENRANDLRQRERAEQVRIDAITKPEEKAKEQLQHYTDLLPSLRSKTHPQWSEILQEYTFLTSTGGMPHGNRAELLAVRKVLGSVEEIKERQRMDATSRQKSDNHVESRSASGLVSQNKDAFSDIPSYMKEFWEKTSTNPKDREIEARLWREGQKNKRK